MVYESTMLAPVTAGQGAEVAGACPAPRGPGTTRPCLDELLGTVAHELRSPLATILSGVSAITSECGLDAFARRALAVMEQQSRQAMRLVEDLFDICAGSLGKLSLRRELVALDE